MYNPIEPLLFFYSPNSNIIQVKLNPGNIQNSITLAENVWKKYFPQLPFEYKFLDNDFNSQYAADQKRGKIFASFSVITILITCLGLLGLTAFTTQQKQKEISMRRVLGASITQVVTLITRNYLWLSLIAACIAFPVAWYFMSNWLKLFQYKEGLYTDSIYIVGTGDRNHSGDYVCILFNQSSADSSRDYIKNGINYQLSIISY